MGYAPDFFGCDGMDGILSIDGFDTSLAEGLMLLTPFAADAQDEKTQAFVSAYKEAYGDTPNQFAADAYDAVYAVFNAMKKTGVNNVKVDPTALGTAMAKAITASDFSYDGVTGKMTWEASGACNKVPVIVELG